MLSYFRVIINSKSMETAPGRHKAASFNFKTENSGVQNPGEDILFHPINIQLID